jgi:acetyl-CoA synthetase
MVYAAMTHRLVFDYHPATFYCCAADVGWITGHSYIVYGPLANGATTVMFESTPLYPDAGRYWRMVDDLGINIFYTAPTALRAIAQAGDEPVKRYRARRCACSAASASRSTPRSGAGTTTSSATALRRGRHLVADRDRRHPDHAAAGRDPTKPGSATLPFFGVKPVVVDPRRHGARGQRRERRALPRDAVAGPGAHGVRRPPALQGDLLHAVPGLLLHRRRLPRDEDGYYWITGRIDDVLNVSGHRLGTAEVESALVAHEAVAEAAVVGFPHPIKGQGIYAYVLLDRGTTAERRVELAGALKEQVRHAIGAFAAPDVIHIAPGLPKTRSGKIMRRILRKIASSEYEGLGDLTTLAEPEVVERLIEEHKTAHK